MQIASFPWAKGHFYQSVFSLHTSKQRKSSQQQEDDAQAPPFKVYQIDPSVFPAEAKGLRKSDIQIQNDKVKIFYFREGSTRALLDCFRAEIGRNASEFRYLPDMDRTLGDNDYSEIFKLTNTDTPHKLRGVSSVALDKFSLSKFLGKYRKVGNLIRDKQDETINFPLFLEYDLTERRGAYCQCRMVNKYVLPLPIGWLKQDVFKEESKTLNLCRMETFCAYADWSLIEEPYLYFPYMVTPHEISYALTCKNIAAGELLEDPSKQLTKIHELYNLWNYDLPNNDSSDFPPAPAQAKIIKRGRAAGCCAIRVEGMTASEIKVAIGNARLYKSDFKKALTGKSNRSYKRYQQVCKLLKEALAAKANLLVLPENFLPWEWLPDISRLCANNQMALITGIEHILSGALPDGTRKVYNLTAVILPYRENDYKFAQIICHHKVHYSPNEARLIRGYRMAPFHGTQYQLFCWRDLWFSVYCCYELASITDRSLFQALADLTVAVEWNRDVPYFSSIMESLCRDLHCYCIQVNSSDFGDSRVMMPAKSEERDLIKTKGGRNHTILMDHIELTSLRDYQRKEYELQRDDPRFKPTPPRFEPCIPEHKENGTLWEYLTAD